MNRCKYPSKIEEEVRQLDAQIQQTIAEYQRGEIDEYLYYGRLKFFTDRKTNLTFAYEQGFKIGRIQVLQSLLGEREESSEELAGLGWDQISDKLRELEIRWACNPLFDSPELDSPDSGLNSN